MDKIWKLKQWKIEINSKKLIFKSSISWKFMNSFKNIEKDLLWWKLMIFETLTSWIPEKIFIYEDGINSMFFSLNRTTGKVTKLDRYENTTENRLELIPAVVQYEKEWMIWVLKIISEFTKNIPAYKRKKEINNLYTAIPSFQEILNKSNETDKTHTITDMIQIKNKKIAIFSEDDKDDSLDNFWSIIKLIEISNKTNDLSIPEKLDWITIAYTNDRWRPTSIFNDIRDVIYPKMYDIIKLLKENDGSNDIKIKTTLNYLAQSIIEQRLTIPKSVVGKNGWLLWSAHTMFTTHKMIEFTPESFLILAKFMEWLVNQYTSNSEISDYFILKLMTLRYQEQWEGLNDLLSSHKTVSEWCVFEAIADEWFKNIWENRKWKKISFCWSTEWIDITKDILPLRKFIETNKQSDFLNNFFKKKN